MATLQLPQEVQSGFASAAAYDAHRPTYPTEAVEQLLKFLEIEGVEGARVLDLAAGTGKFTEILSRRPEKFEIVAVEPHDGMREQLQQKKLERVRIVRGAAEDLSALADESVAAVVVAQAFHWFANMTALKEIHRVLRPTGVFGAIWNIDDYNAPKTWDILPGWSTKMRDLVWTFEDSVPRFRIGKWRDVFDEQNAGNPLLSDPLFSLPIGELDVPYESWLPKDEVWNRLKTLSQIAVLEGQELENVERAFYDAADSSDSPIDEQGRIPVYGKTFFVWTTRIPGEPLRNGG